MILSQEIEIITGVTNIPVVLASLYGYFLNHKSPDILRQAFLYSAIASFLGFIAHTFVWPLMLIPVIWTLLSSALYMMIISVFLGEIYIHKKNHALVGFRLLPVLVTSLVLINSFSPSGFILSASILLICGIGYGVYSLLFNLKNFNRYILLSSISLVSSNALQIVFSEQIFNVFGHDINIHPIAHTLQAIALVLYGLGMNARKIRSLCDIQ